MMMLAPNKVVLEAVFPNLYAQLKEASETKNKEDLDIQVILTPSGDVSVKYRGIWLHSSRNPREEAKRFVQAYVDKLQAQNQGPILLLGFGLGYTAEYIREQYPDTPLVIIEPNTDILLTAFKTRDLSFLLNSPGLIFILDRSMDAIFNVLPLFPAKPQLIIPRAYREVEPDVAKALMEKLSLWEIKNNVNKATVQKFGKRWVNNIIHNRHYLLSTPGIGSLAGSFSSIPALVLAAGPSLDDILPFLPALYDRCLIISVDTALRALLRTGIEPDFVIVVDPQYWNARHLDFCYPQKTCLVTEVGVYPSVLRHSFQHRLLCSSLYPLGNYLEKNLDYKGRIGAGGSVATTALDFALHLGARPIYIAGLDLAYPDFKTHFTGALFEEKAFITSNRFLPAESQSFCNLMSAQPFYAPNAIGGTVLTDTRLSLYTAWFETRIRQLPSGYCKSLTPKGISISGLYLATVDELSALPVIRTDIQDRLTEFFKKLEEHFYNAEHQKRLHNLWEKKEQELVTALTDLYTITQKGKSIVESLKNTVEWENSNKLNENLAELDRINEQIAQSPIKDIAGFLFTEKTGSEPTQTITNESEKLFSYLAYLHTFYATLIDSLYFQLSSLRF